MNSFELIEKIVKPLVIEIRAQKSIYNKIDQIYMNFPDSINFEQKKIAAQLIGKLTKTNIKF